MRYPAMPKSSPGDFVLLAAISLGLSFFLQSCAKKEPAAYKVEVENGVRVVRNFGVSSAKAFRSLKFIEDLSIGAAEGDGNYVFSSPADMDADESGNIYVLDRRDCVIKKYSRASEYLAQFGRKGQGPGEFENPYSIVVSRQNKLYVGDIGVTKIVEFSLFGDYLRTLSLDFYFYYFSLSREGEFLVEKPTFDQDGSGYQSVGRYDFQKKEAAPFFSQRQYWPARIMDDHFTYEFPYFVRWCLNPKDLIFVGSGVKYEISVFDMAGNLLFKFTKDFDPVAVAGEELKRIEEISRRLGTQKAQNPYRENPVYPVFKFLSSDEKDRVWVERYQPLWRDRTNKETLYDIFSADGVFLFWTRIPGHIYPQLVFKNGYLYCLKADESGFSRALRLRIVEEH